MIYGLIYKIYIYIFYLCEINKGKSINRIFLYLRKIYCYFVYVVFNYIYKFLFQRLHRHNGLNRKKRDQKIIVSLTSYPGRIDIVWLTIETLLRQSLKPDQIILWLAEDQFPAKEIPSSLVDLSKRGLQIRWCDNLMSHKKYYYVLQEFSNDLIITADDDSFYPRDFISSLFKMHLKHPTNIVCLTAQPISPSYSTLPSKWNGSLAGEKSDSFQISVNTGSGALFPPQALHSDAFNKALIRKLCPYADDLWITVMAHINGTAFSKHKYRPFPIIIAKSQKESLNAVYNSSQTNSQINNDTQWNNLLNAYQNDIEKVIGYSIYKKY